MKFQLMIEMGNAAMSSAEDLAAALADVAMHVERGDVAGAVKDANGNRVGTWTLD